ncbi:MAG: PQQ-binding-like beta-propeller repeat protein [Planctomycetota bacterium]
MMGIVLAFLFARMDPILGYADWPQASGPNNDYQVDGRTSVDFSVASGKDVLWTTPLPNTGESTPIVSKGRVFLTCHAPMTADAQLGRDILAMCFDAGTGRELWRRRLPATRETDMASGFSDNTAASPVTDGTHVCFVNVGGSIHTFDFHGELIWKRQWVPFGRHHSRQQEPILHNGRVIMLKTVAPDLPPAATTKSVAKDLGREPDVWTRLHAFDLATGELRWVAQSATSVHSASLLNQTDQGVHAILTGRGGGHQPPEEPYGVSLIDAETGKTVWDLPIKGYAAHQNAAWRGSLGGAFVGMNYHAVDMTLGRLGEPISLDRSVRLTRFESGQYQTHESVQRLPEKKKRAITYHTNILVGDYHYFRTHTEFLIGRINIRTGVVEFVQVPAQVITRSGTSIGDGRLLRWEGAIENEVRNKDGWVVYQDKRAKGDGWGHVSAASPIVVGDHLYMPTMVGTVYVLRWNAANLDETALVSLSDLGPSGKTWTLSSLAFADGRLYARTQKQLVCIHSDSQDDD